MHSLLAARAASLPDAPAILSPGGDGLSAGELAGRVEEIRRALNERGLGRGDRVAVTAGVGPEAAVAMLGVVSCSVCVPVNPSAAAELGALITQTKARALLAPGGATAAEQSTAKRRGVVILEGPVQEWAAHGEGTIRNGGAASPDDVALLLRTSGTTARAKLVPATHRQLVARAEAARDFLGLGPDDRCLNPMPLCYGHGLYTGLLFPLLTGGSTILPTEFEEEAFLRYLSTLGPTWYTAGPAHQRAVLGWLKERRDEVAGHRLRFVRCANGSLPREVSEGLEACLGVPVLESYGTSETGMIASPDPHGPRKPGTVGVATGVEVALMEGEIVVRGPTVFSGYEDDTSLNRRSFAGEWFRTGDRGSLDEDGFLTVEGRIDDVINRGGEKISPAEVEAALLGHPDVAEAVVVGVPHPTLQQEVAAAVVLRPETDADTAALRNYVGETLAPFKVPRRVTVLPELPLGPTGKPLRTELVGRLGLGSPDLGAPPGKRRSGPAEARLAELWGEVLEQAGVGIDDDFFELGGDSLSAIELVAAIAEDQGVELRVEDLIEAPTPRLLWDRMRRGFFLESRPASARRDIAGVNTGGDRTPLFAVAGRPGYSLRLLTLGREIAPAQPVFGLQPPDMDWAAREIHTMSEMAAHHLTGLRSVQPHGPYRLIGSSFGGLLVFEMALQIERAGEEVEFLGLIDTEPAAIRWHPEPEGIDLGVAEESDAARTVPSEGVAGSIVAAGTRVAATHAAARVSYAIEDRVRAAITFFYCAGDGVRAARERRQLWTETTTGGLRLVKLPGLHAQFDREPQFSALRDALRSCLAGDPPASLDPAEVFERSFSLTGEKGSEVIRDSAGPSFRVPGTAMDGRVREGKTVDGKVLVRGWASDASHRRAGDIVVAFIDGRYAGYSTCGVPSARVERRYSAPGLRFAGFRMRFDIRPGEDAAPRPRVFALSTDGRASELAYAGSGR